MAIPAVLAAILKPLLGNGLNLVGNAVIAKGKDWVENKLGVELKPDMTADEIIRLKQAEMEHEEELLKLKLEIDKLGLQELDMYLNDVDSARDRERCPDSEQNRDSGSGPDCHWPNLHTIFDCHV